MIRGEILLCDLDAFYASVEQLDNQELRGKPVIVGGDRGTRGVVSACSYEARAYGVRSAMPMIKAKRLCPHGIIRPVNMERYQEMSELVFAIYYRFTPSIEVVSIDEAYLEVNKGEGATIAETIRKVVKEELGLPLSIGVSSNKLLAKIGSDLAKPDGMKELWRSDAPKVLGNCSVRIIPGIGPKTAEGLRRYGITTVSELSNYPVEWFKNYFGARGDEVFNYVHWKDSRPLILDREQKSIGKETTFYEDIADKGQIIATLNSLSQEVGYRLRKAGFHARTLSIKVRYYDFKTITRSNTSGQLLYTDPDIYTIALELFEALQSSKAIRLIGIQVSNFEQGMQLSLFDEDKDREIKLAKIIDELNEKYGIGAIRRGF